jgi:hypothetical protein
MWIISAGVKKGDHVVAEGTQKVREGLLVNPKPFQSSAPTQSTNSTKGGMQ